MILLGQGQAPDAILQGLASRIRHAGFVDDRSRYWALLQQGDVAVSLARHEYFGCAILEAVAAGCWPLLPDRLVYPELFSDPASASLYKDEAQLTQLLHAAARAPEAVRARKNPRSVRHLLWPARITELDALLASCRYRSLPATRPHQ